VFVWLITAVLSIATFSLGRVLYVPDEFTRIQAALDSVQSEDTVLVSLGIYAEVLTAPAFPFALLGDYTPDSAAMPVVDASAIPGSDSTAVLTLPLGCRATIEGMSFRNDGRMGIELWSDTLQMLNSLIEGTSFGIEQRRFDVAALIRLQGCRFMQIEEYCVLSRRGNFLEASSCEFFGSNQDNIYPLVTAWFAEIDSCYFASLTARPCLTVNGTSRVTNCRFGPCIAPPFSFCVRLEGDSVRCFGNRFQNCVSGWHTLVVSSQFPNNVVVSGNDFVHCYSRNDQTNCEGTIGIGIPPDSAGMGPLLEANLFVNCSGNAGADDIMSAVNAVAQIRNNIFRHDSLNGIPSLRSVQGQPAPLTLINNRWENCGYAVDLSAAADARENYWGHNSGPYHAEFNPEGQGDTITGNVPFIPWLTDSTDAADERVETPSDLELAAFPNPFNATTKLQFTLSQRSPVSLKIFDLLGREVITLVDEVHEAGTYDIAFDGTSFSSGLYFVRLETAYSTKVARIVLLK